MTILTPQQPELAVRSMASITVNTSGCITTMVRGTGLELLAIGATTILIRIREIVIPAAIIEAGKPSRPSRRSTARTSPRTSQSLAKTERTTTAMFGTRRTARFSPQARCLPLMSCLQRTPHSMRSITANRPQSTCATTSRHFRVKRLTLPMTAWASRSTRISRLISPTKALPQLGPRTSMT